MFSRRATSKSAEELMRLLPACRWIAIHQACVPGLLFGHCLPGRAESRWLGAGVCLRSLQVFCPHSRWLRLAGPGLAVIADLVRVRVLPAVKCPICHPSELGGPQSPENLSCHNTLLSDALSSLRGSWFPDNCVSLFASCWEECWHFSSQWFFFRKQKHKWSILHLATCPGKKEAENYKMPVSLAKGPTCSR